MSGTNKLGTSLDGNFKTLLARNNLGEVAIILTKYAAYVMRTAACSLSGGPHRQLNISLPNHFGPVTGMTHKLAMFDVSSWFYFSHVESEHLIPFSHQKGARASHIRRKSVNLATTLYHRLIRSGDLLHERSGFASIRLYQRMSGVFGKLRCALKYVVHKFRSCLHK